MMCFMASAHFLGLSEGKGEVHTFLGGDWKGVGEASLQKWWLLSLIVVLLPFAYACLLPGSE